MFFVQFSLHFNQFMYCEFPYEEYSKEYSTTLIVRYTQEIMFGQKSKIDYTLFSCSEDLALNSRHQSGKCSKETKTIQHYCGLSLKSEKLTLSLVLLVHSKIFLYYSETPFPLKQQFCLKYCLYIYLNQIKNTILIILLFHPKCAVLPRSYCNWYGNNYGLYCLFDPPDDVPDYHDL